MLNVVVWCYLNRGTTKCTLGMSAQRRLGSACTSTQSDQRLSLAPEETLSTWLPIERPSILRCAVWSEHSVRAHANLYLLPETRSFFLSQTDFPRRKISESVGLPENLSISFKNCNDADQLGGNEIKCEACRAFHLFFATSLINNNKFNNTGARLLDSIYHVTLGLLWNLISAVKRYNFVIYATLLWAS